MRLSLMAYTFYPMLQRGVMDEFGYLETIRYRYGLRAADLWNWMLDSIDDNHARVVQRALVERELELVGLSVSGPTVWADDLNAREYNHRNLLTHLRAAEILGAKTVTIEAGGQYDALTYSDEQFDYFVTRYREYAQRAHDNGYRIGPENHYGPELVPAEMRHLCQAVDHPGFGMVLHTREWIGEDAHRGTEMLAPWIMHVHLSDVPSHEKMVDTVTTLLNGGYAGAWSIETEQGATYAQAGLMIARVRHILEGWRHTVD